MANETVNVRGASDSNYESMTKEQILTAITEAVQGGTVGDVDTGFVTTIKEQNKGQGLKFWVGTTAEYEALTEKPNNVLYIKTDDTSAEDINAAISTLQTNKAAIYHRSGTTDYGTGTLTEYGHVKLTQIYKEMQPPTTDYGVALDQSVGFNLYQEIQTVADAVSKTRFLGQIDTKLTLAKIFETYSDGITVYSMRGNANTNIYPVVISSGSQASNYAIVTLTASNGAGTFRFEYGDDVYTAYICEAGGSVSVGDWIKKANSTDSGWQTLSIMELGFSAGSPVPKYRKIGNKVYIRGKIKVDTNQFYHSDVGTPSDLTAVFAELPAGYTPAVEKYQLVPGEGARMARLYIRTGGGININYFKEYNGDDITSGEYWVQLDCEFLTN